MERLLIIGNGMASVRLLESLLRLAPQRFDITVAGAEPSPGYNRVLLSALLAQDVAQADIILRDAAWYAENGVKLITGDRVETLDTDARIATLASGFQIEFDRCVFATGSVPVRLPLPGIDLQGVHAFRDIADVAAMERATAAGERIAVIGGGLLGIEAAYGLAQRGADVTLVHVMNRLMERQLDAPSAALLKKAMVRKRIKVLLEKSSTRIEGESHVTGLLFADGSRLDVSQVICAVGIRPNVGPAQAAEIICNRGIVVDDAMETSVKGIYAIGECAEHRGIAYGLVEPAYAQAEVVAARLADTESAFNGMVLSTNLKVSGIPVFSAGAFMETEGTEVVTLVNRYLSTYRKIVMKDGKLVGCILVGDSEDGLWYLDLIRREVDISPGRRMLVHGRSFAEPLIMTTAIEKAA